jgi:hypothetical protein
MKFQQEEPGPADERLMRSNGTKETQNDIKEKRIKKQSAGAERNITSAHQVGNMFQPTLRSSGRALLADTNQSSFLAGKSKWFLALESVTGTETLPEEENKQTKLWFDPIERPIGLASLDRLLIRAIPLQSAAGNVTKSK